MSKDQDMKRRDFITTALAGGLGLGLFIFSGAGEVFAANRRKSEWDVKQKPMKEGKTKGDISWGPKKPSKCEKRKPNIDPNTKCSKFVNR